MTTSWNNGRLATEFSFLVLVGAPTQRVSSPVFYIPSVSCPVVRTICCPTSSRITGLSLIEVTKARFQTLRRRIVTSERRSLVPPLVKTTRSAIFQFTFWVCGHRLNGRLGLGSEKLSTYGFNPSIAYARHAIAIDERRIFFGKTASHLIRGITKNPARVASTKCPG
jgi:hypothetical protein